jgi:limonene-1,2-epoxide hydrolase
MPEQTIKPAEVVTRFWETMNSNDFAAAAEWFADDYLLEWPQSGERIRGRANFAALNHAYPANGRWQFTITRLLAAGDEVVSEVQLTDSVVQALVITFSTVRNGQIVQQVEYWPDPFAAPDWRAQWVERGD